MKGSFGRSCGREEVPGMCIAIVSGVLLNRAESLFDFFFFLRHSLF